MPAAYGKARSLSAFHVSLFRRFDAAGNNFSATQYTFAEERYDIEKIFLRTGLLCPYGVVDT